MRPSDRAGVVASVILAGTTAAHEVKEKLPEVKRVIEEAADAAREFAGPGEPAAGQTRDQGAKEQGRNRPIETFSVGSVRVAVWDNGPDRPPTLTVGRIYQNQAGEWRAAQSFRARDVADLTQAVERAAHAIEHGELGKRANETGQDEDIDLKR